MMLIQKIIYLKKMTPVSPNFLMDVTYMNINSSRGNIQLYPYFLV